MMEQREQATRELAVHMGDPTSPWALSDCWRLNDLAHQDLRFRWDGREVTVSATLNADGYRFHIVDGDEVSDFQVVGEGQASGDIRASINGRGVSVRLISVENEMSLFSGEHMARMTLVDPAQLAAADDAETPVLAAPMPGKVVGVNVNAGDVVSAGSTMMVIEAMKMEHAIKASVDGQVTAVHYQVGEQVDEGVDLLTFEAAEQG